MRSAHEPTREQLAVKRATLSCAARATTLRLLQCPQLFVWRLSEVSGTLLRKQPSNECVETQHRQPNVTSIAFLSLVVGWIDRARTNDAQPAMAD